MLQRYKAFGLAPALAVQGHHIGLQTIQKANLDLLNPARLAKEHPLGLRPSEADHSVLESRYASDGGIFPVLPQGVSSRFVRDFQGGHSVAAMLDVRFLFSALVDADYLATEAHFDRSSDGRYAYRSFGRRLIPEDALAKLDARIAAIRSTSKADPAVRSLREDLQRACYEAATRPPGLYTLTAPTGAGKTLAMLIFALRHAQKNGLRRIVVVLPFLSLIEQTAHVYREILGDDDKLPYVLEDHSMAETDSGGSDDYARLLAENWDAPIVVTTSVRFCESLFANRPAACRKLHNITHSIVLFDEVQTLPTHLVVPTLAALSHLNEAFGCTIVLSTATQPAFNSLGEFVKKYAPSGWQTIEIAAPELRLFERVRRVNVHWPERLQTTSLDEVAELMLSSRQALVIVNVKRHSRSLFELIEAQQKDGLYHLSTDMCPAHRIDVMKEIKGRLYSPFRPICRVVSTQCVEAGVDLDFPTVFRAWGPLEALAQAAGRCNREGRLQKGDFHIFLPPAEDELYPGPVYKMAASVVKKLFHERGGELDLQDPGLFREYYRELYNLASVTAEEDELFACLKTYDFTGMAQHYRLIDNDTIDVLVPYSRRIQDYTQLRAEALDDGFCREWVRRARPLSISLYRRSVHEGLGDWLEPVKHRGADTGWYVYLNENHYSDALGLIGSEVQEFLLA